MKIKDEQFFKMVKNFLDDFLVNQKGYSQNTKKSYKEALSLLLEYFHKSLDLPYSMVGFENLTLINLSGFMRWLETERNCSPRSIECRYSAIRAFIKYCAALDPAKIDLLTQIQNLPRKKVSGQQVKFLSPEALQVLVKQINPKHRFYLRDKTFILMMYDTGARCQEMLDITLSDVVLHKSTPIVYLHGKGNKTRSVPITADIAQLIKKYMEKYHPISARKQDDYLFYICTHEHRHRMSPDAVALFLKKYSKAGHAESNELSESVHPHQLRHSRAMHLYRSGLPQVLLSEFLGHSNPATTRIYAWADTEMKRKAIEKSRPPQLTGNDEVPIWENDEEMIKQLYGLK